MPDSSSADLQKNGHILNICKPIGWSSNDVVRWVKRRTGGKVGHAGTLDPFADGILLVCTDSATKKTAELMALEKEYRAVIEFGIATDTLDIAGKITARDDRQIMAGQVEQAIPEFIGSIEQTPPAYSALRVNGRRAYDLARSGQSVDMKKRIVQVHMIKIIDFRNRLLTIDVRCSKGVYIRSLAQDIAKSCGTIGFLRKLTRTRIGSYTINKSLSLAQWY